LIENASCSVAFYSAGACQQIKSAYGSKVLFISRLGEGGKCCSAATVHQVSNNEQVLHAMCTLEHLPGFSCLCSVERLVPVTTPASSKWMLKNTSALNSGAGANPHFFLLQGELLHRARLAQQAAHLVAGPAGLDAGEVAG
jgi:hypothetical protein